MISEAAAHTTSQWGLKLRCVWAVAAGESGGAGAAGELGAVPPETVCTRRSRVCARVWRCLCLCLLLYLSVSVALLPAPDVAFGASSAAQRVNSRSSPSAPFSPPSLSPTNVPSLRYLDLRPSAQYRSAGVLKCDRY
eukprot:1988529-Rhodomonas_salina.1